jgi:RNA polymerase sigma-70 factor (ECF subfamily)
LEDNQIVSLYFKRDESAITESKLKYGHLLLKIALNILSVKEDSEECVSDTYFKAWQNIPPEKPISLMAFLGRIVRNISINRYNANHAKKRYDGMEILLSELTDCIPSFENVDSKIETEELTKLIDGWLLSLKKEDRILFVKRYWFGESLNAIAFEYNILPNKLAGKMFSLRKGLLKKLEKEEAAI